MSLPQIIHQIDEMIRNTHTSPEKKIENLQNLAGTCWQEVVPEYGNQKPLRILNLLKFKSVGQGSAMKSRSMKLNPKFCMFLTGRLLMVISIG